MTAHGRLVNEADTLTQKDRKSTRLNSSHSQISYAVFCLKKKKNIVDSRIASLANFAFEFFSSVGVYMGMMCRALVTQCTVVLAYMVLILDRLVSGVVDPR